MVRGTAVNAGSGRALICGSMAYDTIMVFEDRFADHILPDKIHILNVSFLVPRLRREFGGCAGNIAYNLKLLGDVGLSHGDRRAAISRPYAEWLARSGVPADHVRVIAEELTAQAFITTDRDNNQITAFHPGAMQRAHENRVTDAQGITLGIVGSRWARGHGAARRAVCGGQDSLHLRSRPGFAACSAARISSASSRRPAGSR